MQTANTLFNALNTGSGLSFGAWQMLPGAYLSKAIASSGFDWILIDCEHGNIEDKEMHNSIHAIASCSVSPIVRIPSTSSWMVKRALDAGAHGILVPLLRTADEARMIVQAAKFPPQGQRGFGSPFSMGAFSVQGKPGPSGLEYLQQANQSLLTIVQIETREALENVEEIAAVDGIDVLFVGPFDLGNSIGHPVLGEFSPELKSAISRIQKAAVAAGKKTGIYCASAEIARKYAEEGFQMISVINDMTVIPVSMARSLAVARGEDSGAVKVGGAYGS